MQKETHKTCQEYFKASGSCADPFFFLVQVIQGTLWPSRTSNSQSRWSWEGPGVGLGPLGEALGVPGGLGGGLGILSTTTKVSARASRRTPSFERLLGGSLGAPWGVLGGPWGVPGRSQATFWAPRSAPDDKGAHPGGSLGGSRRAEKSPETIFLRSQEGKCVYF